MLSFTSFTSFTELYELLLAQAKQTGSRGAAPNRAPPPRCPTRAPRARAQRVTPAITSAGPSNPLCTPLWT